MAIVVDVETSRIAIDTTNDVANAVSGDYDIDHYRQLYRQYVRYLISQEPGASADLAGGRHRPDRDGQRFQRGPPDDPRENQFAFGLASGGESASRLRVMDPTANAGAVVGGSLSTWCCNTASSSRLIQFFAITVRTTR